MLDRIELPLAVGHADVAGHMAFSHAASYFLTGHLNPDWWKTVERIPSVNEQRTFSDRSFVIVDGDVVQDVVFSAGTLLIYGNLKSSVRMTEECELIIAGDIEKGGSVSSSKGLHVFLGGDLVGSVKSRGACKAWLEGDLSGEIRTGHPISELVVKGDLVGGVRPLEKAALLYLQVGGFMPYSSLEAIAMFGYTEFHASISVSDCPRGFYPGETAIEAINRYRGRHRWVIVNHRRQILTN